MSDSQREFRHLNEEDPCGRSPPVARGPRSQPRRATIVAVLRNDRLHVTVTKLT